MKPTATPQGEHKTPAESKSVKEVKTLITTLQKMLDKPADKMNVNIVTKSTREKAVKNLIKISGEKTCDELFEVVYKARSDMLYNMTQHKKKPHTISKKSFKTNTWNNMIKIYKLMHNKTS